MLRLVSSLVAVTTGRNNVGRLVTAPIGDGHQMLGRAQQACSIRDGVFALAWPPHQELTVIAAPSLMPIGAIAEFYKNLML